jgi:DNA-binding transcriptional MocR family regulator
MLAALGQSMPASARWTTPRGGFFSWLTLPGVDTVELAGRAVEQGVAVVPGTLFFPDGRGADSLRLSYSLVAADEIDEGIARLGSIL